MKPDQKRKLVRLIEKERIHFHGPEHRRPGNHAQVFSALHELCNYNFDRYVHNFTYEAHQKPWRGKIKQQVERIVRLAEDCRYARQNELGWRLKLESEILARFSTEVTCKRCSFKLWRSEIEVSPNPQDTLRDVLDLETRQARRKPCSCSEMQRYLDRDDPGTCRIFHDRADEPVKYSEDDPIFGALPSEQKPDRVYGFRKTSRFSRLLDEETSDPQFEGQDLRDIVECSPFNEMRDQVLFPFLVLEAKSETGDSFDDIEIQTSFAIKKLLDVQLKLQIATGERSQWQSGPLVWFLSNRGDDWRIAAAYVEMCDEKAHYHVYHLWAGSILSKDAALQLLLSMDYIFDWARDFQREAVLSELQILAGRNAASIVNDSEIGSLGDHMRRFLDADLEQCLMENQLASQDTSPQHDSMYRWLDSQNCVFRSMSWAHARVSALYITKENLKILLRSFTSEIGSGRHAREFLRLFQDAWRVTPDALEALEFMWTGMQREDPDLYGNTQNFCTVFTVASYFTSDWEQVLELTYIAIAENALDDLKAYVDLPQPVHVYPSQLPYIKQDHLVGYFRHFRQSSARERFHAAIRRCCLSSVLAREVDLPDNFFLVAEEPFDGGIRYRLDLTMLPDQKSKTRKLVAAVYNQCKKGMRDPEEPFLRMSACYGRTPWDDQVLPSVWNLRDLPMQEGALYSLLGSDKISNNGNPNLCIYVMDDTPAPQAFPLSFDMLESYFVVQTTPRKSLSGSQIEWNTTFITESISPESTMIHQLETQFRDLVVYQKNELASGIITRKRKVATYSATTQLPPHMRSSLKTPHGHWVKTAAPADTYEDLRRFADWLVARKYTGKLITCLYTQKQVDGRAGLGSQQRQHEVVSREEHRKNINELVERRKQGWRPAPDEIKPLTTVQKGDAFNFPNLYRKRKRGGDLEEEETHVGVGDWLTDHELELNLRLGKFGDGKAASDRRVESSRRVGPWEATDTSAEVPTIAEETSQSTMGELVLGDHVSNEELDYLLKALHDAQEKRRDIPKRRHI